MEESKKKEFADILVKTIEAAEKSPAGLPIDLAQLGSIIRSLFPGFSIQSYGFDKLKTLLQEYPELVELVRDESVYPPRYFARRAGDQKKVSKDPQAVGKTAGRAKTTRPMGSLRDFVVIIHRRWGELAQLALKGENWEGSKEFLPLQNYVRHTFTRLCYENKICVSPDGEFAAFNTGLVDDRYQPIFALCVKNTGESAQAWFLDSFCVAGENFSGKRLVTIFNLLPQAAYYFSEPSDAIYNIEAGPPYIDWEHIIEENSDRVPPELLEKITRNFDVKDCSCLCEAEIEEYKESLSEYLRKDRFAYRQLIDVFNRSLDLALKKVRWNYKTAIPVYYPTFNKLSLLLPLCLIAEDHVDVALVVERTKSGNYLGHTIYPLDWAYSNARLITRPDSDWLRQEFADTEAQH
ncbi:MAG: DUF3825 domain-containing protein [Acidithiobacillus sp.]|nr:DUF3825 domain-containing protein [Acidithiobacillus sp.]